MPNSLTGFQLAAAGVNLSSTNNPANQQNAVSSSFKNVGKDKFRYPLKMMDNQTDYLEIKIYDYIAGGFSVQTVSPYVIAPTAQQKIQSLEANKKIKPKYYITLPIPQAISDNNSVTWGDDTINPLEAYGLGTFNEGVNENPIEAAKSAYTTVLNSATNLDARTKQAILNQLGASAVNAVGGNVSASSLISRATGQVLNSNLELLFQGVNLRAFPFTFDFAPRDKKESDEVKSILRVLKKSMTPSNGGAGSGGNTGRGLFINSPSIFQLAYRSGPGEHPFLNRFKPMALTDMSINYTGSNTYATYEDGTPVHIQVSLTFKEINPVYAEDHDTVGGVGY